MPKEQVPGNPQTRRYTPEEEAAAVRMVRTLRAEIGTEHGTVQRVANQLGYGVESVRQWVKRADIDAGHARRDDGGGEADPRTGTGGPRTQARERDPEARRLSHESAHRSALRSGVTGGGTEILEGVAYNFTRVDREQLLLMPPSVVDWLSEDHLAWFVIDVVAELDMSSFLTAYRLDGRGGAAYDPQMMLALLVYSYCVGERSSRRTKRRLVEDVAFRVVAANQQPDHATIVRYRASHEAAIAGLFGQVLAVCARAGLLRPGLVAIDGTKLNANASRDASRTAEQIAAEILAGAAATDAAEDAEAGTAGRHADGDCDSGESDGSLAARSGRRPRLLALLDELEAEAAEKSYEAHLAKRGAKEAATGKPIGARPTPGAATHKSRRQANLTDPEIWLLKTKDGYV